MLRCVPGFISVIKYNNILSKQLCGSNNSKTNKSKLSLHASTIHHINNNIMTRWLEYKRSLKQGSIISQLSTDNKEHMGKKPTSVY